MSTAVLTNRLELGSVAETALKGATRFWFGVTLISQLMFAFTVASFYGVTALRGNLGQWGRFISHGYARGDTAGNLAVILHVSSAVIVMLAGAIQLVPRVRERFPVFHRWNGRVYMLTAATISTAGMYMTWIRGSVGDIWQHMGSTGNALLIWVCAAMALRYALARNFRAHRPWAMRLFLVTSASWFLRVALFLSFAVLKRPFGFDPTTFQGPFLTFLTFAQYLVPLAVLEIYLRARESSRALPRLATAGLLAVLSLATAAGTYAVTMAIWVPQVRAAYDPRKSIAETLSVTIAASGIDSATKQYHELKTTPAATYNFEERELNNLGYELLRAKKFNEAIGIFQINVEAYPKSSNAYDSLGEGYMNAGDRDSAIANYRKSLELNPKNRNGAEMLKKLGAR